jgi:hypothetical protein
MEDNSKMYFKDIRGEGVDWNRLAPGQIPLESCFEHRNESAGSIEDGEFTDQLIFRYLPTKKLYQRDSSVGTVTGYGLNDWGSRVQDPAGAGNFSLHHRVQTGSGAHPISYQMVTGGGGFPRVKRPGREADHSI